MQAARTPRRARRRWIYGSLVAVALMALLVVGRWLHATATQDVVTELRRAPACRVVWNRVATRDSAETWHLELHDDAGRIDATLRLPPGDGPCAAVVILGGLRTGRDAVELVDVELPYAVAALDYARNDAEPIEGLRWLSELPGLIRDFKRTGVALRDLRRAVGSHARVESSRVFILGASLGTPLACAVTAAENPAGLALLYGFADHAPMFAHRLRPYVRWGPARELLAAFAGWLSGPFDPAVTLPQACDVPVLLIGSAEDVELPRQCTQSLWEAVCGPKEQVNLPGGHIDAGRKQEILHTATRAVRDWLDRAPSASVGGTIQGDGRALSSDQ
jgi:hypothetical protein